MVTAVSPRLVWPLVLSYAMELSRIVRLLLRWSWLIALLALAGGSAGYLSSLRQAPAYEATTTLLVTTGRPSRDGVTSQMLATRQQLAITYKELLTRRPVLEAVAAQLGLDPLLVADMIEVDVVRDTALLKLSATAADPVLAADLANVVVEAFIAQEQDLLANPYVADRSGLSVVEPAVPPASPRGAGPLRNGLIGAVVGAMLALGGVCLIGYLDTAVRSAHDLAALTGLPVLAEIAKLKGGAPPAMLVTVHRPDSAPAEAYRMIRARVEFAAAQRPLRSLVITSARPGEGKSVTAANLALALAQTGLRVILIDANLRRPTLHALFKRPNSRGLSTALQQLGNSRVADNLLPTGEERLSLLPSGPAPANPASLLAPQRITLLADELAAHADLLIFDSPQCLDTVDASLLLRACDAALLVVQANATRAEALQQAYQLLQASQTQLLGAVLNHGGSRPGRGRGFAPGAQRVAGPDRPDDEPTLEGRPLPGQAREVGGSK